MVLARVRSPSVLKASRVPRPGKSMQLRVGQRGAYDHDAVLDVARRPGVLLDHVDRARRQPCTRRATAAPRAARPRRSARVSTSSSCATTWPISRLLMPGATPQSTMAVTPAAARQLVQGERVLGEERDVHRVLPAAIRIASQGWIAHEAGHRVEHQVVAGHQLGDRLRRGEIGRNRLQLRLPRSQPFQHSHVNVRHRDFKSFVEGQVQRHRSSDETAAEDNDLLSVHLVLPVEAAAACRSRGSRTHDQPKLKGDCGQGGIRDR